MTWTIAEPESRELLVICLKKLKVLSKVRLIDAGFIWTEPHSKRIKVKLTIQKEVCQTFVLNPLFLYPFIIYIFPFYDFNPPPRSTLYPSYLSNTHILSPYH